MLLQSLSYQRLWQLREQELGWYHCADLRKTCDADRAKGTVHAFTCYFQPLHISRAGTWYPAHEHIRQLCCHSDRLTLLSFFCVEKRWKIKLHFPEIILTLHACTVSMTCGHHTSSNRVNDTDTDFQSLSLLLVNQSQLDLLVNSAGTDTRSTKGRWMGQTGDIIHSSLDAPADNGHRPITLHFSFWISYLEISQQSKNNPKEESSGPGDPSAGLCCPNIPWCNSSAHPLWKIRDFIKSTKQLQHSTISPILTWMLGKKSTSVCDLFFSSVFSPKFYL